MTLIDKLKNWWKRETTPVPDPPRSTHAAPPPPLPDALPFTGERPPSPVRREPDPVRPARHLSSSEPVRRTERPSPPARRHSRSGDDGFTAFGGTDAQDCSND